MADPEALPLVVDLDGTLTRTDTLVESAILAVKRSPFNLLRIPLWLLSGKAGFKCAVAAHAEVNAALLPYNEPLLTWLQEEKARGRKLVLATAAHHGIAEAVQRHLGLFDQVIATSPGKNLKGPAKLAAVRENVGERFAYAGNGPEDFALWSAADAAIPVGLSAGLTAKLRGMTTIEREFPDDGRRLALWLRAVRVHQFVKNILIFVPLLTAFSFLDIGRVADALLGFVAFCLAAAAGYMFNDLLDLDNDRAHPRKSRRPFASGRIPILHGALGAVVALAAGLGIAAAISGTFAIMVLCYLLLTSSYSWALKQYVLIDVLALSVLYSWRILAGAVAIDVPLSSWLLAFSVFIFFSLALIKRCTELLVADERQLPGLRGRDYQVGDLRILWPLGIGSALCSVVIFGLFISSPETRSRYASPEILWLAAIGLIYWLSRMWLKTSRQEMHDDPIVYTLKDNGSRIALLAMLLVVVAARLVHVDLTIR